MPAAILIRHREELIAVAAQAFAAAPWHETPADAVRIVDRMWLKLGRRDFAAAALDGAHPAGFAYGHTDTVCAAMNPRADGPVEAFEVVEIALAPAYQGQGIGRALYDALLDQAPSPRLLLTHPDAPARQRYERWGWTELARIPSTRNGRPLVLMLRGRRAGRGVSSGSQARSLEKRRGRGPGTGRTWRRWDATGPRRTPAGPARRRRCRRRAPRWASLRPPP